MKKNHYSRADRVMRMCHKKGPKSPIPNQIFRKIITIILIKPLAPSTKQNNKKTCLTSSDTHKEYQNPSVTKIYSVGFDHDAELLGKK